MEYKPSTDKNLTGEWLGLELREDLATATGKPSTAPDQGNAAPAGPTN